MQQHALLQKALCRVSRRTEVPPARPISYQRADCRCLTTKFLSSGNCP